MMKMKKARMMRSKAMPNLERERRREESLSLKKMMTPKLSRTHSELINHCTTHSLVQSELLVFSIVLVFILCF